MLFIWIVLLPVQVDTMGGIGLRFAPADIILIVLLFWLLIDTFQKRLSLIYNRSLIFAVLMGLWFSFTLVNTYSALGAIPQYAIVNKVIGFGMLAGIYWMILQSLESKEDINHILKWYLVTGSLWNIIGIGAFAVYHWKGIYSLFADSRISGLLIDANAYGGFLVSVFLLQAALLTMDKKPKMPLFQIINAGLLLLGIFLSFSRSAYIALEAGCILLVMFYLYFKYIKKENIGGILQLFLLFLIFIISTALVTATAIYRYDFLQIFAELFPDIGSRSPEDIKIIRTKNIDIRVQLIQQGLKEFLSSPVWGVGIGVFPALNEKGHIIHNTYIWLLAETGIIGFSLFLGFIISIVKQCRVVLTKNIMVDPYVIGAVTAIGTWLGLMIGIEAMYQRHYWFMCAILGASYKFAKDKN